MAIAIERSGRSPKRGTMSIATSAEIALQRFNVELDVTIRQCEETDLSAMEWFGMFAQDRQIIREAFLEQEKGMSVILIAVVNGLPAGQVWIDFRQEAPCVTFWSVR